ncbi:threonine/serine exporter family protein [Arthrobacter sp. zg-Y820]|uniref:threonine/serine ThrE exporter family protein n=1 Tax=Arthrobacter sp. zg-Y820 TaxID=2894192 RepID=UPI0032E7F81C
MENTSDADRQKPAQNPDPMVGLIPVIRRPGQESSAGQESAGQESAGQESAGQESAGQESAGQESAGQESAAGQPRTGHPRTEQQPRASGAKKAPAGAKVRRPAAPGKAPKGSASKSTMGLPTGPGGFGLRSTKPKPPPPTTSVMLTPSKGTSGGLGSGRIPGSGFGSGKPGKPAGTTQPPRKPRSRKTVPGQQHTSAGSAARQQDRSSAAARRMLRRLVQGETPPTQAMSIVERLAGSPYANPLVRTAGPDASARKTLDLALSLAETMFRYGAGALEVETAIIAVTAAFGLESIEVDITNQSVLLNHSPKDQTPITVMRVVRSWTNNYAGLGLVHQLVTDIIDGGLSRAEAANRLNEITHQTKPFPRWGVTASTGVFSAAIVGFIGGGPLASLVAFLSTVLVSLLQRLLGRWRVPDFFSTAAAGFVVTAIAMIFWSFNVPISPGIVVAGGILLLLPTGRLVSAVQDAINGFPVTASGRFLSAFLTFGALVAGIAVALVVGALAGMPRLDVTSVTGSQYPFVVTMLLLAVALATICVVEQSPMNLVLPTVLTGAAGYLVFELCELVGLGPRLTPAVAAVFIGMLARMIALRMGAPQLIVAVPAVLFLFPGLSIFRAMYGLSVGSDDFTAGAVGIFNALTVILAIAGGVVMGDNLARPLTRSLSGNDRRNRRR